MGLPFFSMFNLMNSAIGESRPSKRHCSFRVRKMDNSAVKIINVSNGSEYKNKNVLKYFCWL